MVDEFHMDKEAAEETKDVSKMGFIEKLKHGPPHYKALAVFLVAPKGFFLFSPLLIRKYLGPISQGFNLLLVARLLFGVSAWVAYKRWFSSAKQPFSETGGLTTRRFATDALRTLGEFGAIYAAIFSGGHLWEMQIRGAAQMLEPVMEFAATPVVEKTIFDMFKGKNLLQFMSVSLTSVFLGIGIGTRTGLIQNRKECL